MSKITQSARGEDCLVWIPGCTHDPDRTIWSHCRLGAAGRGKSIKAVDLAGAYACTYCDSVYDGQTKPPEGWTRRDVDDAWNLGHYRSLKRLTEKGILK